MEKLLISRQRRHSDFDAVSCKSTFPYLYLFMAGKAPEELQITNVSQHSTNRNAKKPKPMFHHRKKPGNYRTEISVVC